MKDSGIKWIGEIPEKWGKCRLKNVITIENGKEIIDDGGNIPVYGSGGIFKFTDRPIFVGQSLLMGRKGTIDKPMLVDGPFWTVDTMFYTSRIENINARFLYYACSGLINFDFYKSGSVLPSMTQTELYNVWITLPGPSEQQAIAAFLDKKCFVIDNLISNETKQIEKLKEYRQAIITKAVTQGLDPNVPMKDSGVEWIGKIPTLWDYTNTKFLFSIIAGGTPNTDDSGNFDGNVIWITPADYKTEDVYVSKGKRNLSDKGLSSCSASKVPVGSIIFSKRAPIGSVAINSVPLCTNQGCLSCVSNKVNLNTKYFYYLMSILTEKYELLGSGTTFKEISAKNFGMVKLPHPPRNEQDIIVKYLDSKCEKIKFLIKIKESKIQNLQAYKQSLIYEYVTGEKRVSL